MKIFKVSCYEIRTRMMEVFELTQQGHTVIITRNKKALFVVTKPSQEILEEAKMDQHKKQTIEMV